jgi:uncharacterized protein (TIGR02301 family)
MTLVLRLFTIAAFWAGLALAASAAQAQTAHGSEPPYEQDLLRLSEVMGALHFLRPLCGNDDAPSWRDRMATLLDTEVVEENRRRRFIARFNRGYRGFSTVYRDCTISARLALRQYISEGEAIIGDVTSRYGR